MVNTSRPAHGRNAGAALKLFQPDPPHQPEPGPAAITLRQLFETYSRPAILAPARAHAATLLAYTEALAWWERLTDNPTLEDLRETHLADFSQALAAATYRRGLAGCSRPLAAATQRKIATTLQALLRHAGPRTSPRPAAGLIQPMWLAKPKIYHRPRPSLDQSELVAILTAADQAPRPTPRPGPWWRAWLATAFYTGLRSATLLALRWEWIDPHPAGFRWILPPEAQAKTGKAYARPMHAVNRQLLDDLAGPTWPAKGLIFPWPHAYTTLAHDLERLGRAAGIPAARRPTPHTLRRAHAQAVAMHGLTAALALASRSLGHADQHTTAGHYFDPVDQILASLPTIWPPANSGAIEAPW